LKNFVWLTDACDMKSFYLPMAILLGCLLLAGTPANAGDPSEVSPGRGHILMIRHAYAPGTGDPPGFRIGDCTTQRNLDSQGRVQAREIGNWLRSRGITNARVYSSQWCRCLETAELIGLGPVTPLPALNSFYERPQDREPNLAALREFIARQPTDGDLIIMVTHYVTVAGLTGEGLASGEGLLLQVTAEGNPLTVGRLAFGMP
jgi:hypothetical protein